MTGIAGAQAEDYPARTVTIIVPFAAGGPADITGRIVADIFNRPAEDFEPIRLSAEYPELLVVRKDFPANNLKEFVAYAKSNAVSAPSSSPD
jgi:putative tricarboxylic transport membrane protein